MRNSDSDAEKVTLELSRVTTALFLVTIIKYAMYLV